MYTLTLPPLGEAEQELACNALANTLACALDEALLRRVGGFQWSGADRASAGIKSMPSNRYDRAALHLWQEVLGQPEIRVPLDEAQFLLDLLDDCFKVASRLHGGRLWPMMQESVWRMLLDRLRQDLAEGAGG